MLFDVGFYSDTTLLPIGKVESNDSAPAVVLAYETESLSGTFGVWRRLLHDWGRVRIHPQSQRQPLS